METALLFQAQEGRGVILLRSLPADTHLVPSCLTELLLAKTVQMLVSLEV